MTDLPDEDAARAAALNGPMMRFRAGEITARQADSEWEAADVLPYAKTLPGGVPTLAWSLTLAVAWIATRHLDLISAVALRSQHWQEVVANEPAEDRWTMDLAMARFQLEAALCRGQIEASGKRYGPFAQRDAVPSLDWQDLAIGFTEGSVALDRGLRGLAPALWHEVRLRPGDVMRLWPAAAAEAGAPAGAALQGLAPSPAPPGLGLTNGSSSRQEGPVAAERPPAGIGEAPEVAAVPTDRTERRAAKAHAIQIAKALMASAPDGMPLPALRAYIQQREPLLSRDDIDGIKHLYPDIRRPGDNARTRVARTSPK